MGPTDDHLPTVDPSIQQHAGRFEWPSWRPGLETLIQVGAAGKRIRMQSRSAGCVDGSSGSFFLSAGQGDRTSYISSHIQGESVLVMATAAATWATQSAQLGPGDGGEGGNKAELAARVAHCMRSIPMHGDPAAALDCGTLAAAATAARRLWEGGAEQQLGPVEGEPGLCTYTHAVAGRGHQGVD